MKEYHKSGMYSEVERLREGTRGTAAEIREFVNELGGKSPQEVLGLVGSSGLAKGIFLSTLLWAVLLGAFTVIPYALAEEKEAVAASETEAAPAEETEATDETAEGAEDAAPSQNPDAPSAADAEAAAEAMKLNETKDADKAELDEVNDLLDNF